MDNKNNGCSLGCFGMEAVRFGKELAKYNKVWKQTAFNKPNKSTDDKKEQDRSDDK